MREVVIKVECDVCRSDIEETEERSNSVTLKVYGNPLEMDLCNECIERSFIQAARPVTKRRKRKAEGEFPCHCGKTFGTARGLSAHQTRQAHD